MGMSGNSYPVQANTVCVCTVGLLVWSYQFVYIIFLYNMSTKTGHLVP